jgi:hypothetical protein
MDEGSEVLATDDLFLGGRGAWQQLGAGACGRSRGDLVNSLAVQPRWVVDRGEPSVVGVIAFGYKK